MTAVARRRVTSFATGHLPPAAQVAHQVRSSTEATYGAGARRLPPGWTGGHAFNERHVKRKSRRAS